MFSFPKAYYHLERYVHQQAQAITQIEQLLNSNDAADREEGLRRFRVFAMATRVLSGALKAGASERPSLTEHLIRRMPTKEGQAQVRAMLRVEQMWCVNGCARLTVTSPQTAYCLQCGFELENEGIPFPPPYSTVVGPDHNIFFDGTE